jgi:hypothetical protein
MRLNPPPQPQDGVFSVMLVESVRLLFEAIRPKYEAGITAGTTQTQAGAVALACSVCNVETTANANDGARLPTASAGDTIEILNNGAQILKIWPATGGTIDGGSADAADATTIAAGASRRYYSTTDVDWITLSG